MSEDIKKVEKTEAAELSEQDLNKVAGGVDEASPRVQLSDNSITKFVDSARHKLF